VLGQGVPQDLVPIPEPRGKHCPESAGLLEDGKEALEVMEKSAVRDAAPVGGGMSRIEMLRMLRAVRSDVSVRFVSGNADATWIDELGAYTALIIKPFLSSQ